MKVIGINKELRDKYEREMEEKERKVSKETECGCCGAILQYNIYSDVKRCDRRINAYETDTIYTYVVCPHCKRKVIIEDYRKDGAEK